MPGYGWTKLPKAYDDPVAEAPGAPVLTKQNWPTQAECTAFYGNPHSGNYVAENLIRVTPPWKLDTKYSYGAVNIPIHKKCAPSLLRVLNWIWYKTGKSQEEITRLHYDRFSGSYNDRSMRGSGQLSMHAYGIALDWDDLENQFHHKDHVFQADSLIVQAFEGEGWVWGGRWNPPDAMHVQGARIR